MLSGLKRQGSEVIRRPAQERARGREGEGGARGRGRGVVVREENEEQPYYRNLVLQKERLQGNMFNAMGNCLFCQECIVGALNISRQRMARQHNVKRQQYQNPIVQICKDKVEDERLQPFVVMPEEQDVAVCKWWELIPFDHVAAVRYPHERHGNAGKTSHYAKTQVREDFLRCIDLNSQPNGRSSDSHSCTHYFLPKFTNKNAISSCDKL